MKILVSCFEIYRQFHLVPTSKQSAGSLWHTPDAVCTVLDSRWWTERPSETCWVLLLVLLLLLLPLALQPAVGFGLSNNTSPFVPIYHQLSPSSHLQHLKISFHFFSPSFPGSSSSSRPFQFLSEDLFGHPILLHSLQVTQPTYSFPLYPFYYIFSFIQLF